MNAARNERIVEMVAMGVHPAEIADALDMSLGAVQQVLARQRARDRRAARRATPEQPAALWQLQTILGRFVEEARA